MGDHEISGTRARYMNRLTRIWSIVYRFRSDERKRKEEDSRAHKCDATETMIIRGRRGTSRVAVWNDDDVTAKQRRTMRAEVDEDGRQQRRTMTGVVGS